MAARPRVRAPSRPPAARAPTPPRRRREPEPRRPPPYLRDRTSPEEAPDATAPAPESRAPVPAVPPPAGRAPVPAPTPAEEEPAHDETDAEPADETPAEPAAPDDQDEDEASAETDEDEAAAGQEEPGDEAEGEEAEAEASGAGRGGGGEALAGDEDGDEDGEGLLPPVLVAQALDPLQPPGLDVNGLSPDWPVAGTLDPRTLRLPEGEEEPGGAGEEAAQAGAGEGAAGQGEAGETAATRRRREREDPREAERRRAAAREQALRAYGELAARLRSEQAAFYQRSDAAMRDLRRAYQDSAGDVTAAYGSDLQRVDAAATQARADLDAAVALAEARLDDATRRTRRAISRAGGSAHALISAGDRAAAGQIASVVSGLVTGHLSAYNDSITQASEAFDQALLSLNRWRDERESNYSTGVGDVMEAAKNESRQARIPRWTEGDVGQLTTRKEAKVEAWENSRDTTVENLSCSYSCALQAENTRLAAQAHTSVNEALTRARGTVRRQSREGRRSLREMHRSHAEQIHAQAGSTRSQLNSQARMALGAAHARAGAAVEGLRGAARAGGPAFVRGVEGFEQNLRGAAPRGEQALRDTAGDGPPRVLDSVHQAAGRLEERLTTNTARTREGLAAAQGDGRARAEALLDGYQETLAGQGTAATEQLDQTAAGVEQAFDGLADTVGQSASQWAQPVRERMSGMIASKQAEAAAALEQLRSGQAPQAPAGGGGDVGGGGDGGGGGGGEVAAPDCSHCGGGGSETEGSGDSPGLDQQVEDEVAHYLERETPAEVFSEQLDATGSQVETSLQGRSARITGSFGGGFAGTVDETGVVSHLRGLTAVKGRALDQVAYPEASGRGVTLDSDLREQLGADTDEYRAAAAYLGGDAVEGARLELEDSTGFFNDDEERIEATMRALSPDQLAALGRDHEGTMEDVRDALGGTDRDVFDALADGNHALADAHRLREAVDKARREGDEDAVHSAIERYTGAPTEGDWRETQEMDADTRRQAVVRELGGIVPEQDAAHAASDEELADLSPEERAQRRAEDRAVAYVTRDIQRHVGGGRHGEPHTITLSITGANRDLAEALLRSGEGSVEARAARLGVEMQRRGEEPNATNIDRATFDPRFKSDLSNATPEERAAHRRAAEQRARVVMLAAERYADGAEYDPEVELARDDDDLEAAMSETRVVEARDRLVGQLRERFGSDTIGADLAAGLLTDARPSPDTAALAMRHAMYSETGTDEDLLFRFTERMDRDEIAAMRAAFREQTRSTENPNGLSLDAELGVYGEGGTFTELSGDDRLRMERAMRGVARNDRERLENAAFALQQQRRETGGFGSWLADDTLAEQALSGAEQRLELLAGGEIAMNRRGEVTSELPNFDGEGRYTGEDRDNFLANAATAQTIAQNYSSRVDAFADVATAGIAVIGAIAAAAITVITGGAAGPLIAAAIATGLASMAANYAIKGGRYGWEQAAIDLGMTAVQAVTAGVGAQLGAAAQVASKGAQAASQASRTIAALSRIFTGNPVVDQIIVGAITGTIGGLGNTMLTEQTWAGSTDDIVGNLFAGLIKGALSGAATAAVTNSMERIGRQGATIGDRLQGLAAQGGARQATRAMLLRGLGRGAISGVGGMAGRGAEILVDAGRGKFSGDFGDALESMGEAGLRAAVQGIGEGAAEAVGQRFHGQRLRRAEAQIAAERDSMGLPPLDADTLSAAAGDLMLLNQVGDNSALGRALNLDHIASHGGLPDGADAATPRTPRSQSEAEAETPATPRPVDGAQAEGATPRPLPTPEVEVEAPRPSMAAEPEPSAPTLPLPASGEAAPAPVAPAAGGTEAAGRPVAGAEPGRPRAAAAGEVEAAGRTQPAEQASGGGEGDGGGGRPPAGGGAEPAGEGPEPLFRDLSDAEIDAAFDRAESRIAMRVPADALGADRRPLPPLDGEATLAQRQRAAALHNQADDAMARANGLVDRAIAREAEADITATYNERRAGALRREVDGMVDEAVALEAEALRLRAEAEEFASGRRSAVDDLPGPEAVDAELADLLAPMLGRIVGPDLEAVQRAAVENHPDRIPRLSRELLSGEHGGRLVFRVESERSRSLVHVDADGNVRIAGDASVHLNFGSYERAVEFVLNNSEGSARIITFEVDEAWVRQLRSAAMPEVDTGDLQGPPRLVDVNAAADQIEVPGRTRIPGTTDMHPGLIRELERFIIPGSGRVHEIPAPVGDTPGGAAAAIARSRMQLSAETVIDQPRAALDAAAGEVLGRVAAVGEVSSQSHPDDPHLALGMRDVADQPLSVRVEVADTEGGDVASFRRNPDGDDPAYIVSLSPHAPAEAHARALAHELAEIRHHAVHGEGGRDALRAGEPSAEGARLSAHDRGRLAELEVLAARRDALPESETAARQQVESDIAELAAHLGLLHAPDGDPRMQLARDALGDGAPAREALAAAREQARQPGSDDVLGPSRRVDPDQPLSEADRRRIDAFEEVAESLVQARGNPEMSREQLFELQARLESMARDLGLVGSRRTAGGALEADPGATARAERVTATVGADSAAGRELARLRAGDMPEGAADALQPGRPPDPAADVPSPADRQRMAELDALLDALPPRPAPPGTEPPAVRRLRHRAEALAASMGLVHGSHAEARAVFARAHGLADDVRLESRLVDVIEGAERNPLLLPERGTPDDIPLLRRQLARARGMLEGGDTASPPEVVALVARLNDTIAGHEATLATQRLPGEIEALQGRLERVRAGQETADRARREAALQARIDTLQAELATAQARAGPPADLLFRREHRDLVRQLFGDSPEFQRWGEFMAAFRTGNVRTASFAELRRGRARGSLIDEAVQRAERMSELLAEWAVGRYASERTGRLRDLQDLPLVEAVPGGTDPLRDAGGQDVRLADETQVRVAMRDANDQRVVTQMRVDEAVEQRRDLMQQARDLRELPSRTTAQETELKRLDQSVRDLSEALGEAAGLLYAETLPGGVESVSTERGSGVTDLLHIGPDPDRVVTVIECKGGESELGTRRAEQGGRAVRAEQTTPEYLRSLANEMIDRGNVEQGNAILEALQRGPPAIQVVVVRQGFDRDTGAALTPTVTDYPVRRRGL